FELPQFASFPLLDDARGIEALRAYFAPYVELARANDVGLVLDAPTWRASPHWGELLGYDAEQLADFNRRAVAFVDDLRKEASDVRIVIGGCVGPCDDAYAPSSGSVPTRRMRITGRRSSRSRRRRPTSSTRSRSPTRRRRSGSHALRTPWGCRL